MTTFDPAEVRGFAASLTARMDRCDNGEGLACATLDAALRHYAQLCCEFREGVRQWGRAVFAGRVAFDPEVERVFRGEGWRLYGRALEMSSHGQKAEGPCYMLEGQAVLHAALWSLYRLLNNWVTPKLAVGPAPRLGWTSDPTQISEVRQRIESLPPLPTEWKPDEVRQQIWLQRLRKS